MNWDLLDRMLGIGQVRMMDPPISTIGLVKLEPAQK